MSQTLIRLTRPCPACKADRSVMIDMNSSFVTDDYIDVPAHCEVCEEGLRVVYDFALLEVD